MWTERLRQMKNSNDIIGNQTCDLPACSAVPEPTVPPCAPLQTYVRTVIQMMPSLLPYTYCTLHYSLTTLLLDTIIVSTFEM